MIERRTFLATGISALALTPVCGPSIAAPSPSSAARGASRRATARYVRKLARTLAHRPYRPPQEMRRGTLAALGYDGYREIRFRTEKALWRNEDLGFEIQLFPSGYLYTTPVDIHVVDGGKTRRIRPNASLFDFGGLDLEPSEIAGIGFSGFRIHAPLNRRDHYDEFMVFQGASYFRGVGKGQFYGLSARALSLETASPGSEEFPNFRSFWIETPETPEAITVHALLDSPSVAGAYTFVIRPGRETVVDTEAVLYPRRTLTNVGLAPLTSMFLKNPHDPGGPLDFRPSIHDSDGLAVWNGQDERLWRPLLSPSTFQASYFGDRDPKGYGLIQRERRFEDYQDLEARYERRPSAWVAPGEGWGAGFVELVEIPTDTEYADNIVAAWRPAASLVAYRAFDYTYRLAWREDVPALDLMRIHKTRIGTGSTPNTVRFVLDFVHDRAQTAAKVAGNTAIIADTPLLPIPEIDLTASAGTLAHSVVQPNPHLPGIRVTFELDPHEATEIELRLVLQAAGERVSETWLYRWST
jgi:glucans biosynthesis protein